MGDEERAATEAAAAFQRCGLTELSAKQTATAPKKRNAAKEILEEAGVWATGCKKEVGSVLIALVPKFPKNALQHRADIVREYVLTEKLKTDDQVKAAWTYIESQVGAGEFDQAKRAGLEQAAGVGAQVTPEQLDAALQAAISADREQVLAMRYHYSWNALLGSLKRMPALKWADGQVLQERLKAAKLRTLGPETEADKQPPPAKKKEKQKKPKAATGPSANGAVTNGAAADGAQPATNGAVEPQKDTFADGEEVLFPRPGANSKAHTTVMFSDHRGTLHIANTKQQLLDHLARTGGQVITRFPPEPNGYLHIGHAKAMYIDFGLAKARGGCCILRFDDTNPAAEKQEYIDHILEISSWLGWQPAQVTHSSDYFQQLFDFALKLIDKGLAFVCEQTAEDIHTYREKKLPSPYRDRSREENHAMFLDMARGLVPEGRRTLRLRIDERNGNANLMDPVAYRVIFTPHPRMASPELAAQRWCVYPTYDFTHSIVDSLEDVTHSLCTLEFETRRAIYYWLLEVLDLYKPFVRESARLNLEHNVMSKRKLNRLVTEGYVNGWDDPRLLTLAGLRRRGVAPQAINDFCKSLGASRSDSLVPLDMLDSFIRAELDAAAPRALAVLRPLRVVLSNQEGVEQVTCKRWPPSKDGAEDDSAREADTYAASLGPEVFIEEGDFREDASDAKYYGLAPGKEVLLRFGKIIKCTGCRREGGRVVEVQATARWAAAGEKPPKGVLNWVSAADGQRGFSARLYDVLFHSKDPAAKGDDWLADLNRDSCAVVQGCILGPGVPADAKPGDRFQLERLGFFCIDPDSTAAQLVLNRTCTLKAAKDKAPPGAAGSKKKG